MSPYDDAIWVAARAAQVAVKNRQSEGGNDILGVRARHGETPAW